MVNDINKLYELAKSDGYKKSIDEFKVLMKENEGAVSTMYDLAKSKGYNLPIETFKKEVGFGVEQDPLKKKELSESGSPLQNANVASTSESEAVAIPSDLPSVPGGRKTPEELGSSKAKAVNTQASASNNYSEQDILNKAPRKGRFNIDGEPASHVMSYAEEDGKFYAYPTLFQDANGEWYQKDDANNFEAFKEAKKKGEIFEFNTEAEAASFANGDWKKNQVSQPNLSGTLLDDKKPFSSKPSQESDDGSVKVFDEISFFDKSIENVVNKDLIESEEEDVVPLMQYHFGDYGFSFEETGAFGDAMIVRSANGKELNVNLDRLWSKDQTANELKSFLSANKKEDDPIITRAKIYENEKRNKADKDGIKSTVSVFNSESKKFHDEVKEFSKLRESNNQFYKKNVEALPGDLSNPQKKANYDEWLVRKNNEKSLHLNLENKKETLGSMGQKLDYMAGQYASYKSKSDVNLISLKALASSSIGRGVGNIAAGLTDLGIDVGTYVAKNATIGEEKYKEELIRVAKEDGLVPKDEDLSGLSKDQLIERLGGNTNDAKFIGEFFQNLVLGVMSPLPFKAAMGNESVERTAFDKANSKVLDLARKGAKYYGDYDKAVEGRYTNPFSNIANTKDTNLGYVDLALASGEMISEKLGTTKEWADMEKEGFWGGALLGLYESLPAMVGGNNAAGFAQRTAQMFSMTTSMVNQEMSNDPAFDNISESEKNLVKVPLGIAVGVLESVGFRNVLNKNPMIARLITSRALSKATSTTTVRSFSEIVQQEVESGIKRGLFTVGAAALSEFETGAAQEIADVSMKQIYNAVKEKDMFQTPETLGDYAKQVLKAGAQEAVGGFILGTPGAVSSSVRGLDVKSLDNRVYETFEDLYTNDDTYKTMYVSRLKQQINESSDPAVVEKAKADLADVNKILGIIPRIPKEYAVDQRKESLQLIWQKEQLEKDIETTDGSLSKPKKILLEKINARLEQIALTEEGIKNESNESTEETQSTQVDNIDETDPNQVVPLPSREIQEETKDIQAFFGEDVDDSVEQVNTNLSINNLDIDPTTDNDLKKNIRKVASTVSNILSNVLPDTKIVLHETASEFNKYAAKDGTAEYNVDQNVIHVNMESATNTTVPHEVFQAVFVNKVKTEANAMRMADKMVSSLKKVVKTDSELGQRLEEFSKRYEESSGVQNEEKISELVGILASNEFGYTKLDKPSRNAVIEFFKDVARFFGVKLEESFGQNDAEVIDMINNLAQKISKGEAIVDEDLKAIDSKAKGKASIENRQQKPKDPIKVPAPINPNKLNSIDEIVSEARNANFSDEAIKDYLTRIRKFPAKKVNKLMEVSLNDETNIPAGFKNITGGVKKGLKLFRKVYNYRNKLTIINDKQKEHNRKLKEKVSKKVYNQKRVEVLNQQQILDKTIEFLEKQPEYIAEADPNRKGMSTIQAAMVADLQTFTGVRPGQNLDSKVRVARTIVQQRKIGAKELMTAKRALRNLLRQSLPKSVYTKGEVITLINKINQATRGNIGNVMNEVVDLITSKNVAILTKKLNKLLKDKYYTSQSGRQKGTKVDSETRKSFEVINANITSETDINEVELHIDKLRRKIGDLNLKVYLTPEDLKIIEALEIAIKVNELTLMEDSDIKVVALDLVVSTLTSLKNHGRSILKQQIEEDHQKYVKQLEIGYETITGNKIDMTIPSPLPDSEPKDLRDARKAEISDRVKEIEKQLNIDTSQRNSETAQKNARNAVVKFIDKALNYTKFFMHKNEAFDGLMDLLDQLPGEMFGGNLQTMFTDRLNEAEINYKKRKLFISAKLNSKLEEIYGENWAKAVRANRVSKNTGLFEYIENMHKNSKGKNFPLMLSQDQMAYLYNLNKDPNNEKALEKTLGPEHKTILETLTAQLTPENRAFADWQVDEFYPSVYPHYNETYKKIYRTDMPHSKVYGGKIYRDISADDSLNFMSGTGMFNTSTANSGSTKTRLNSDGKITIMNQIDVLATYVDEMEHFAAYAEPIRDMNKLFSNSYVRDAIKNIHGQEVYSIVMNMMKKIASRGKTNEIGDKFLNKMNSVFIVSRLALSPVVMLKQLTSFMTYLDHVGIRNYLKYAAKNKSEQLAVWKEVSDNSTYLKERDSSDIFKTIESYTDGNMQEFVPTPTKDFILDFLMWTTKAGDRVAILVGGLPNYSYYKAEFKKKNPGATEQEAINHAITLFERDTKQSQQSSDIVDKDSFQTGHPVVRAMNMFMTTPKQYLRKEIKATRNLYRKISNLDLKAGKGTWWQNTRSLLLFHGFMPAFFQYVTLGFPGLLRGWRDDDDEDMLRASVIGNLNAIFILGEIINGLGDYVTNKPWAGTTSKTIGALQIAGGVMENIKRSNNVKDPVKKEAYFNKAMLELVTITGLPAPTIAKFIDNYSKVGEGEIGEDILRLLNYSEYMIGGSKAGKKENVKSLFEEIEEQQKQLEKEQKDTEEQADFMGGGFDNKGFEGGGFEGGGFDNKGF